MGVEPIIKNKSITTRYLFILTIYFRQLGGEDVPEEWKGALNISYKLGGTLINNGW